MFRGLMTWLQQSRLTIKYPKHGRVIVRRRQMKPGHERVVVDIHTSKQYRGSNSKVLGLVLSP